MDSGGIPPHVENCYHCAGRFIVAIVDGMREAVRQGSVEPEVDRVLTEVMLQTSEIGDDTVSEVITNSEVRGLVKVDDGLDVMSGFLEDDDPPSASFWKLGCIRREEFFLSSRREELSWSRPTSDEQRRNQEKGPRPQSGPV
jgi:hypothetical protein